MSFCCEPCGCGCVPQCKPKYQNIQCPRLDAIWRPTPCICGGNDWDYNELMCATTRRKKRASPSDTLGHTVGIVKTPLILKLSDMSSSQISGQRFATYLKAFAYLFLSPEYEWTPAVLNLILKEGQKLYSESDAEDKRKSIDTEKGTAQLQVATTTYSSAEMKVGRVFRLLGNDFCVDLSDDFSLMENLPGSSGDHLPPIIKLENLKKMLKEFFKKKNYCLVSVNGWYVLIWKVRRIYFVLDICGRRLDTFESEKDSGAVVLVCLSSLDNVNHLIVNLSGFSRSDTCTLREMKVVMMGASEGPHQTPEYGERADEFVIVNADYAYLKSPLHLSLKKDSPLRSRSALPVGVAALVAAKIDHPATWTERMLAKIICYGVSVCRYCWEQCVRSTEPVDFDCFPNQLRVGQFLVSFVLQPGQYEGTWKCVPNYRQADLRQGLENLFDSGNNNLLIQINQQIYAVWKKNDFIYLLDPYRHRVIPEDNSEPSTASMRVFSTLDAFLNMFNLILLSNNRTSRFFIHTVHVRKIEQVDKADCLIACEEAQADELEVKSLNEAICFVVDDVQCLEDLGAPSDDEEEEPFEEEETPETESELDHGEEEGGEGGGAVDDVADVESSDDEGVDHRRNKSKNLGNIKKRKGGEKAKKHKRDMSERNKKPRPSDTSKSDSNKNDSNKNDSNKNDSNKNDSNNDDSNINASNKIDANKIDANKIDANKIDANKIDANKIDGNKIDSNKNDSNKSDSNKKDSDGKNQNKEKGAISETNEPNNADSKMRNQSFAEPSNNAWDDADKKSEDTKLYELQGSIKQKLSIDEPRGDNKSERSERRSIIKDVKSEDDFDLEKGENKSACRVSSYPGHSFVAHDMAVVASESGCYDSMCKLIRAGFKCADRILAITPHGNFVVFRSNFLCQKRYYLFDGCTCNVDKFRHLDLNCGTEGLLSFRNLHAALQYMIDTRKIRANLKQSRKRLIDKICCDHAASMGAPSVSASKLCL